MHKVILHFLFWGLGLVMLVQAIPTPIPRVIFRPEPRGTLTADHLKLDRAELAAKIYPRDYAIAGRYDPQQQLADVQAKVDKHNGELRAHADKAQKLYEQLNALDPNNPANKEKIEGLKNEIGRVQAVAARQHLFAHQTGGLGAKRVANQFADPEVGERAVNELGLKIKWPGDGGDNDGKGEGPLGENPIDLAAQAEAGVPGVRLRRVGETPGVVPSPLPVKEGTFIERLVV